MKKKIRFAASAAFFIMAAGCATIDIKMDEEKKTWETIPYKPALEACHDINQKFLKTFSFAQIMVELGKKEGIDFVFTPSSDDVFVQKKSFSSWVDAALWLDSRKEYKVKIDDFATGSKTKTIEIKKITPSLLEIFSASRIEKTEDGASSVIGNILLPGISLRSSFSDFTEDLDFDDEYLNTERLVNDFYYHVKNKTNMEMYFEFDAKQKALILTTSPQPITLTPYKMNMFVNYLTTNSISFTEDKDSGQIFISDNYLLWKKSQNFLSELNRFSNYVYGIKTDEGYYEIADSRYPAEPLAIELISWTPNAEREYNVYYDGKSRKVITKERSFVFFSEDKKTKFTIRTY